MFDDYGVVGTDGLSKRVEKQIQEIQEKSEAKKMEVSGSYLVWEYAVQG